MKTRIASAILTLFFTSLAIQSGNAATREIIKSTAAEEEIEFYWTKPEGTGPFPALLLIHPEQDSPKTGGEAFVKSGQLEYWAQRGFVAIAISQPGYGGSKGSPDFCGPSTQRAAIDVVKHFQLLPDINPKQFFIYGGSRGAVVASMIATNIINLRGVILKSGVYDFVEWSHSRLWYDPIKLKMVWEIGWLTLDKLKERSAFYFADKMSAPVLMIHGTKDDRAPLKIAENFATKINATGGKAQLLTVESEHIIPMTQINSLIETFLRENLKER